MTSSPHESHFDERASTWDSPAKVAQSQEVAASIRAAVALTKSTRMLEYGAGTGLLTQALRDDVGPVTLADTSAGMRGQIEQKIADGALVGARVWGLDLSTAVPPDEQFDLVVTVLALHHIVEVDAVLAAFAALLASGGHLCVVDLEASDGTFHAHGFVGHDGFARDDLELRLRNVGFSDAQFSSCGVVERDTGTYPMFLAVATR